jgi:mRNA interferase MazF
VVVPYSTSAQSHPPLTVPVTCQGQPAVAVVDQVRAIGKDRLVASIEVAPDVNISAMLTSLAEILEMP